MHQKLIIFTDLDGTLLNLNNYKFDKAVQALEMVRKNRVPLIFCSAKTIAEQIYYRNIFSLNHPFIVENGGAVCIEKNYFSFEYEYSTTEHGFNTIVLGSPVDVINKAVEDIRDKTGLKITTYADMSINDICAVTDLDKDKAARALQRKYSQTVTFAEDKDIFIKEVRKRGFQCVEGGRFHTVMGTNNKGKAVSIIKELYENELKSPVTTVGVGDSQNDIPMLQAVDIPVLVKKHNGFWQETDLHRLYMADKVGPAGWNQAVISILEKHGLGG